MTQPRKVVEALKRRVGYLNVLATVMDGSFSHSSRFLRNFNLVVPQQTTFDHDIRYLRDRGLIDSQLVRILKRDKNGRLQGTRVAYFRITKAGRRFLKRHRGDN